MLVSERSHQIFTLHVKEANIISFCRSEVPHGLSVADVFFAPYRQCKLLFPVFHVGYFIQRVKLWERCPDGRPCRITGGCHDADTKSKKKGGVISMTCTLHAVYQAMLTSCPEGGSMVNSMEGA